MKAKPNVWGNSERGMLFAIGLGDFGPIVSSLILNGQTVMLPTEGKFRPARFLTHDAMGIHVGHLGDPLRFGLAI
jgi:hypothetical protein